MTHLGLFNHLSSPLKKGDFSLIQQGAAAPLRAYHCQVINRQLR